MPLRLMAAGRTDVGLQREQNEDAFHAQVIDEAATSGIFIVSDGMGGYHAGEVASQIAVETILEDLLILLDPNAPTPTVKLNKGRNRKRTKSGKKTGARSEAATIEETAETTTDTADTSETTTEASAEGGEDTRESKETRQLLETVVLEHYAGKLSEAVKHANSAIVAYGDTHREARGLGATLTAALVVEGQAFIANVGDSRTYLLRDGKLERVTRDHSLVERLVEMGQITPNEVYDHPSRNLIYRSLGAGHADVDVDIFLERLQPGDALLLGSDGLWEMIRDPDLERLISEADDVEQVCDTLIKTANANGGEDNITAVLVRCVEA